MILAPDSEAYHDVVAQNLTKPCQAWTYNNSFWRSTIIQEWDLVCHNKESQKLTQQITFIGLLFGVFTSGVISDRLAQGTFSTMKTGVMILYFRIGRVKAMLLLLTFNILSGSLSSFAQSYWIFLIGIWGCGFASIGFGTVVYVWMMELIDGKPKTIFGCVPHLNFAFWGLVLAGIAYLVPDWRQMEMLFTFPLALLFATYWIIPESPR